MMKNIKLIDYANSLSLSKVDKIKLLLNRNYGFNGKYFFPSGAIEIYTFESNIEFFDDLFSFFIHIEAIPFLGEGGFNLPEDFLKREYELETLSEDKVNYWVNGYLKGFYQLSGDTLWNCKLEVRKLRRAFKVNINWQGLYIIGETAESYFSFMYQSID